ncbi:DgyrCDS11801 [Dimorphilus gyrociliatus]|uniref:DgyrCDS11801 n=1 Tax=Dimorphilus gyrociliatus TaxID=2664684 RepID=A0A7I8W4N9_9ANNE|nr:DgyrCDS11801 [Dimorphilus gyrociliatus]
MRENDWFLNQKRNLLLRCLTFIRGDIKGRVAFFRDQYESSRSYLPKTDLIHQIEEKNNKNDNEPVLYEPSDILLLTNIEFLTIDTFFERLYDLAEGCSIRVFQGSGIFRSIDDGISQLKRRKDIISDSRTALGLAHSKKRDRYSFGEKLNRQVHEYMKVVLTFYDKDQHSLDEDIRRVGFQCTASEYEKVNLNDLEESIISDSDKEDTFSGSYKSSRSDWMDSNLVQNNVVFSKRYHYRRIEEQDEEKYQYHFPIKEWLVLDDNEINEHVCSPPKDPTDSIPLGKHSSLVFESQVVPRLIKSSLTSYRKKENHKNHSPEQSLTNSLSKMKKLSLLNKAELYIKTKNKSIGMKEMYHDWSEILDEAVKLGSSFYHRPSTSGEIYSINSKNSGITPSTYQKGINLKIREREEGERDASQNNNLSVRVLKRMKGMHNFSRISKNYSSHRLRCFCVKRLREQEHLRAIGYCKDMAVDEIEQIRPKSETKRLIYPAFQRQPPLDACQYSTMSAMAFNLPHI